MRVRAVDEDRMRYEEELEVGGVYEASDPAFGTFVYLALRLNHRDGPVSTTSWQALLLEGGYPLGASGEVFTVGKHMWAFIQAKRIA